MNEATAWNMWVESEKKRLRRLLSEAVKGNELTHEAIENVLVEGFPEYAKMTVEDDSFHSLITEIYADYCRNGGVDY